MDKRKLLGQIAQELAVLSPQNYGIMNSEGKIIESTFSKDANKIISKFIYQNSNMPAVTYIREDLADTKYTLYIFKISLEVFLICVTDQELELITWKFKELARKFGYALYKTFKTKKRIQVPDSHLVREHIEKEPLKALEKIFLFQELALSRVELKDAMLKQVKNLKHPWPLGKKRARAR